MMFFRCNGQALRTATLAVPVLRSSALLFSTTVDRFAPKKLSRIATAKASKEATISDSKPLKRGQNKSKKVLIEASAVAPQGVRKSSARSKKSTDECFPVLSERAGEAGTTKHDEITLDFTVDVLRIVEEWSAACAETLSAEGEGLMTENDIETKGETHQGDNTSSGGASESTTIITRGKGILGVTALGERLTRVAKRPTEYPMLYHMLFHSHERQHASPPPQCPQVIVSVLHAAEIVQSVENLSVLLTFLRVYRTGALFDMKMYKSIMDALFRAVGLWRQQIHCVASAPVSGTHRPMEDKRASVKTSIMWLILELYRFHFDVGTLNRASDVVKKQKKKTDTTRKTDDCAQNRWFETTKDWVLAEVAVPLTNQIAQEAQIRELQSLSEGVVELAIVFLTSAMTCRSERYEQDVKIWQRSATHMQTAINVYLKRTGSLQRVKQGAIGVDGQDHIFSDLLDALRLLAMADTAFPPAVRERVKHDAVDCFLKLCSTVAECPAIFTDVLCTPEMGQLVRSLPSKDLRETVQVAVFTGATLFSERADDSAVELLLQRSKVWETAASKCNKDYMESDESEASEDVMFLMKKSRRSNVAFALFSAGFEPVDVLSSGLCVGHNALEVLEMLRTAALFSRSFAFAPLPTRISASLMAETTALIEARIRAEIRAGTSPTELLGAPKSLREVLENEQQQRQHKGENSEDGNANDGGDGARDEAVVPLEKVLHLALATSMEFLVRGEDKKLSVQLVRLLTLLEREGSYHYLVDGLALLIDAFVERIRVAGRCQAQAVTRMPSSTSLDIERSLSEMTALFVPRVVEATQRQLTRVKRASAMSDAEEQAAMQLLQKGLDFTVYVSACAMNATTAKQLVGLHASIVKGLVSGSKNTTFTSLSETVMRMNILVSHVAAKQRDIDPIRHPSSHGLRHRSIVLNDVVAVHLKPIAATVTRGCTTASTPERCQVLSIVSLLFRLVSEYSVEAEPTELRAFRTNVLDPSLTRLLHEQNSKAREHDEALDLDALSEITLVMCVPHTIHHLSSQLLYQLTRAVTNATPQQLRMIRTEDQRRSASKAATRLLLSAAAVCQLRQESLTAHYLEMVEALGSLVLSSDIPEVLRAFAEFHVPTGNNAVIVLRNRLAEEAASPNSCLSLQETVSALQVLSKLEDMSPVACATVLQRIIHSGHAFSPGEAGIVVRIATKLQLLSGALPAESMEFLQHLPASLAEMVLRVRQQCAPSDIPLVLQGFSQLNREHYAELQDRVMKGYILRTIQVRLLLTAKEVVECLESYIAARITHQYLFGVLLARVTDMKLKFSLPLAVRLVACGVNAIWDKSVQTACLTAAQPVFLGLVRHLLLSDPDSLPSVSSNALVVLQCLTQAFPNDPTSDLVLQNMASHYTALSLPTMIAVLQLISRKSSTEYNILRCMTEHATLTLFPLATPKSFAELTRLFVQCGVRSRTLFDAVTKRFKEVRNACDGEVLSTLAEALTLAHVDLEQEIIITFAQRTETLANEKAFVFEFGHCITLLGFFALIDLKYAESVTVLLLRCAIAAMEREGSAEKMTARTPIEINILLSSCIRVTSPKRHASLVKRCADTLMNILDVEESEERAKRVLGGGWQADLMLVVQLTSNLVRLGLADHPAVPILFEVLYEKRSALMRRRLLLHTTTETIEAAGEHTHKQLYALLVEGKLLA